MPRTELLAPAGQPDAAYAALHYGADAVYLGLDRFSARAEAANFSPEQLEEVVAYAHSLTPKRRIYLALNTLVQERELPAAMENLCIAAETGVDAVIVQDLGIAKTVRERFPSLTLHASTQLAIHNIEGIRAARELGFGRVTLARELTLRELGEIARHSEIETETFIHGTLCYSYSGLCLFSSIMSGRSGNRGRCVYSCREAAASPSGPVHPFSLKDMALGKRVLDLAEIGITSLKIEGRKKSPLYVAATVDHYRRILDGKLGSEDVAESEARLKTIFARPWTKLFLDSRHNPEAADPVVVGHRGAPVGTLERVAATPAGPGIFFTPALPVERHDGLQIDVPGHSRPYGLPVDHLYSATGNGLESVFAAPAGKPVAVALPIDAPVLTPGLPVYQASSQAVKRSYPFSKPKPGAFGARHGADIELSLSRGSDGTCLITAEAHMVPPPFMATRDAAPITASVRAEAPAFPARDAEGAEQAAKKAFSRMGGSRFEMAAFAFANPDNLYVKPGDFNQLRRDLLLRLEEEYRERREVFRRGVTALTRVHNPTPRPESFSWSIVVEDVAVLDKFTQADFAGLDEAIIMLHPGKVPDVIKLAQILAFDKIRFALPIIAREGDRSRLADMIAALTGAGHSRWLLPNLGSLHLITRNNRTDLAADWPLYITNTLAGERLLGLDFSSFTLSPEDDAENYRDILAVYAEQSRLTVYADLPLFLSAACAHAQMGKCRDAGNSDHCRHRNTPTLLHLEKTGTVEVRAIACGSVVLGGRAFSLAHRLEELNNMGARHLRVDLRWRDHTPDGAVELWRRVRNGLSHKTTEGNYSRGLV